jgi:hypothetical protein
MMSFIRTIRSRFATDDINPWLLPVVLVCVLGVRVMHLTPLHNTDAIIKWLFVRRWLATGELPKAEHFSHHNARWAINLPIAVVQSIFGDTTLAYYVPILLVGLLQAFFTFRLGVLLGGPLVGALATLAYSAMPVMGYLGGQLMPECFESAFVLGAFYAMLRAAPKASESTRRGSWLAVTVGFLVLAWLSRETVLFYLPGFLLATWCAHRSLKAPIVVVAGFGMAVAFETAIYRYAYGFRMGRFSIVSQHHLTSHKLRNAIRSVGELFARYADLPAGFGLLLWASLAVTIGWLWVNRRSLLDAFRQPLGQLMLLSWGFLAVNTFGLRSLNPPRLIQPPNARYLIPIAPALALIVFAACAPLLHTGWERLRPRLRVVALGVVCSIALFTSNALANLDNWGPRLMLEYEAKIRQAFDGGVPIYVSSRSGDATFNARGYLRAEQVMAGVLARVDIGANRGKVIVDKRLEPWRGARRTKAGFARAATQSLVGKTVLEVTGTKALKFKERKLEQRRKTRFVEPKPSKRRKRSIRKRRARSKPD